MERGAWRAAVHGVAESDATRTHTATAWIPGILIKTVEWTSGESRPALKTLTWKGGFLWERKKKKKLLYCDGIGFQVLNTLWPSGFKGKASRCLGPQVPAPGFWGRGAVVLHPSATVHGHTHCFSTVGEKSSFIQNLIHSILPNFHQIPGLMNPWFYGY